MSITPVAPQTQPITQASVLNSAVTLKKNDHDGDEVKGADPTNEPAKGATGSANPNLGKVVNTTA